MKSTPRYEMGARVFAVRHSSSFFRKGDKGTIIGNAGDGCFHVLFDNGSVWWLDYREFKRIPVRRQLLSQRLAAAWLRFLRGGAA